MEGTDPPQPTHQNEREGYYMKLSTKITVSLILGIIFGVVLNVFFSDFVSGIDQYVLTPVGEVFLRAIQFVVGAS